MPIDAILTTLLFAAITGWAITWRDLKRENERLFTAATRTANERNGAVIAAAYWHSVSQTLGQRMREAGLDVPKVGWDEPDCENCADEFPIEIEVENV